MKIAVSPPVILGGHKVLVTQTEVRRGRLPHQRRDPTFGPLQSIVQAQRPADGRQLLQAGCRHFGRQPATSRAKQQGTEQQPAPHTTRTPVSAATSGAPSATSSAARSEASFRSFSTFRPKTSFT